MGILDAPAYPRTQADIRFEQQYVPALLNGRAALANWENTPFRIMWGGDSLTYGWFVSTVAKRYASVASRVLAARLGNAPLSEFSAPGFEPGTLFTNPWTSGGGGTPARSAFGLGRQAVGLSSIGQYVERTVSGTTMDVWWTKFNPGGVITVKIDGVDHATTINTANSVASSGFVTTYPLGADGSHTVRFTLTSGTRAELEGVQVTNAASAVAGIRSAVGAWPGWTSANWEVPGNFNAGRSHFQFNPHVIALMLGTNDYNSGVTPAVFDTNMRAILAAYRANVAAKPTFVLVATHLRNVTSPAYPWQQYVDKLYGIAADFPADTAVFDLSLRLPAVAGDTLGLYSDTVHYSDKGAALVGSSLAQFLLPK